MPDPDTSRRDLVKCEDMRIHAERARAFLGDRSLDEFLADDLVQAAVVRCIEVIGEAARMVSEDSRRLGPAIPWQLIVGMRHVLAHDYGAVSLDKVHDVVRNHVPQLLLDLAPLIARLERDVGWRDETGT